MAADTFNSLPEPVAVPMLLPVPVTLRLSVVAVTLPAMLVLVRELCEVRSTVLPVTAAPRVMPPPVAVMDVVPADELEVTVPEELELNELDASKVTDVAEEEPIAASAVRLPEPAVSSMVVPATEDVFVIPPAEALSEKSEPAEEVPLTLTVPE